MPTQPGGDPSSERPLRVWPAVVAAVLQTLVWLVVPFAVPDNPLAVLIGGVGVGAIVLLWWLFFSRAPWLERVGVLVFMVAAVRATKFVVHPSIAGAGMGMLIYGYSVPALGFALAVGAAASRTLSRGRRRGLIGVAVLLGCAAFTLIRTGGITGDASSDFHWRWTPTPEQLLLARGGAEIAPAPAAATRPAPAAGEDGGRVFRPGRTGVTAAPVAGDNAGPDWSGFRGPTRDSVVHGVRIDTDWSRSKPVEVWRRPIGPGWSSFAVRGDVIYTQEQRGDDEMVSSYALGTGAPIWTHRDSVRFYESNGGAGPRGTPTLDHGRVYTFGATGLLNALDARDGTVVWSRNAGTDTKKEIPEWGFASSPLVVGDEVIIATAGVLAAYDAATGAPRWVGPAGGSGYSSPQLATIDGVAQVLLVNGAGVSSLAPADGTLLWTHAWHGDAIVQPAVIAGGDVLVGAGSGMNPETGVLRAAVTHGAGGWSVAERWSSSGLKPYYNDFVVHMGHAYGFDGSILACIDLADGSRSWKGGRYGHGQLMVLADQDVLLVLSEEGDLALVAADPGGFRELARFKAIDGKTWNHPVIVGDMLLVRNGEEMAAFRLKLAAR